MGGARTGVLAAMVVTLLLGDPAWARRSCVVTAEVSGLVSAATAEHLEAALQAAGDCQLLLVRIDTPGGALEATRRIATAFLESPTPVVSYVAPGAARAGSAGVFITMAAHVAAMAPSARIGAAHPVVGPAGKDPEEAGGQHLARKVENDTAAFARSIAQRRGRNVEWAEAAVRRSVSATAEEAVARKIVDRIAPSQQALLESLHGQRLELPGGSVVLATRQVELRPFAPSFRQRTLAVLANPDLAFLLLMVGLLGILIELSAPGLLVPGLLGGLAILLAALGMSLLPVQLGAVLLIVAAAALLIAEVLITSYGLLSLAGIAALVIGSLLFVDTSDPAFFADATVRLSLSLVLPLAGLFALLTGLLAWRGLRDRRRRSSTGAEGLLGEIGQAVTAISPAGGRVSLHGERWSARSEQAIEPGTRVRVVEVQGLTVLVKPG